MGTETDTTASGVSPALVTAGDDEWLIANEGVVGV